MEGVSSVQNLVKHVKVGDNITFTCPFQNFDHFEWLKGGVPYDDSTLHVELLNISSVDEGMESFKCNQTLTKIKNGFHLFIPK